MQTEALKELAIEALEDLGASAVYEGWLAGAAGRSGEPGPGAWAHELRHGSQRSRFTGDHDHNLAAGSPGILAVHTHRGDCRYGPTARLEPDLGR